ncbi:MAG: hypothetical protein R6V77_06275 [Candidatus Cloacimonadaceae bacterium]
MSGLLFGSLFWGILIILIGISIVLKHAFNINFPIIRLFLGVIIILLGFKLIVGSSSKSYVRNRKHVSSYYSSKEFDVIFGSRTLDLTKLSDPGNLPGEISVVFGNALVIIPDNINLEVFSTTVFGSTILPDRSYAGFGEDRYVINNNPEGTLHRLETNTVFGRLEFEIAPVSEPVQENIKPDSTQTKQEENF